MNQKKKKKHLSGKGNFPVAEEKLLCAMCTHMAVQTQSCMHEDMVACSCMVVSKT